MNSCKITKYKKISDSSPTKTIHITKTELRVRDQEDPLLKGKYTELIINNYKDSNNSNSTNATYYDFYLKPVLELTSDATVQLIGQTNYDYLYNNLILLKEYESILSLLTPPKITTVWPHTGNNNPQDNSSNSENIILKKNILDELKVMLKCESVDEILSKVGHLMNESNKSITGNQRSTSTAQSSIMPSTSAKCNSVPETADNFVLKAADGSSIILPFKPKDLFHIVTPEITKNTTTEEQRKLKYLQAVIDWKLCAKSNEEGFLPIHIAASDNDADLVRRHGAMLKAKKIPIDIVVKDMTPLQMAITSDKTNESTVVLLKLGADITQKNIQEQNVLHLAATSDGGHMKAIIDAIFHSTNSSINGNDDTSGPSDTTKKSLLMNLASSVDVHGDTPLMLACRSGNGANIKLLVDSAPETVDVINPTSGNTALHVIMATTLKYHCTHIADNDPTSNEILSALRIMLQLCKTHVKNFNNVTAVDLMQQHNSRKVISFVANELNKKNTKQLGKHKLPMPIQKLSNTTIITMAPKPKKTEVGKMTTEPNESLDKMITDENKSGKPTTEPNKSLNKMITDVNKSGQPTTEPNKSLNKMITDLNKSLIQIRNDVDKSILIKDAINAKKSPPAPSNKRVITVVPSYGHKNQILKPGTRKIGIPRMPKNITQTVVGAQNDIILVSDGKNIAGVLTKVNVVNPPGLVKLGPQNANPTTSTAKAKPKIEICNNQIKSNPKTFIIKYDPLTKKPIVTNGDSKKIVILKRKLETLSDEGKRSILKTGDTSNLRHL